MLLKKNGKTDRLIICAIILLAVVLSGFFWVHFQQNKKQAPQVTGTPDSGAAGVDTGDSGQSRTDEGVVEGKIIVQPEIDYKDLENNQPLKEMMGSRKKQLGLDNSLDMVVNSDETFTIGDIRISMSEILKQAFTKEGEVFEENIETSGEIKPKAVKQYGIYVVQPGDNIWNIHFHILKEYYDHQGIIVAPKADEPVEKGLSSGIGKVLKFSETMVIIYNLIEKKVDTNIDLLEPLSKIVVYNMDEVFSLLKEINYENIDRSQFDGKTIWIPSKK
jgi:hypothetical protein